MRSHLRSARRAWNSCTIKSISLLSFALALLALVVSPCSAATNPPAIPHLIVAGVPYSNVVVRSITPTSVMIMHARGLTSLNRTKLTPAEEEDLGLVEKVGKKPEPAETLPPGEAISSPIELWQTFIARVSATTNGAPLELPEIKAEYHKILRRVPLPSPQVLIATPAITYLLLCFCFLLICAKAGKPSPVLVWLPVVQILPVYRAADMSPFWFIAIAIDILLHAGLIVLMILRSVSIPFLYGTALAFVLLMLVHLIGWIIWCFKIPITLGKSPIVTLLLLLPGINLLAIVYLAFSKGKGEAAIVPKPKPSGLINLG